MTRTAIIRQLYAARVERQPFSRFTAVPAEQAANGAWRQRAAAWGDAHVDAYGNETEQQT